MALLSRIVQNISSTNIKASGSIVYTLHSSLPVNTATSGFISGVVIYNLF